MGYSRNVIVVHTGEAVIAVGGAYGTLSEIGHALSDGIPVIGLKTWPLTTNGDGVDIENAIIQAESPSDAVDEAVAAVASLDADRALSRATFLQQVRRILSLEQFGQFERMRGMLHRPMLHSGSHGRLGPHGGG